MNKRETQFDISSINQKTYKLIKDRIFNSTYSPGQRINLTELREELGISPTPIKDGLFRLAGEGLVEVRPRRGIFVKQVSEKEIEDTFDARIIIEPGVAEVVAKRITHEQIEILEKLYQKSINFKKRSYSYFLTTSGEFHLYIVKITNNDALIEIYKKLNAHMRLLLFQIKRGVKERLPASNKLHGEIFNSLKKGNPERARRAMKDHLIMTKEVILK